jgi:hypothetical protein
MTTEEVMIRQLGQWVSRRLTTEANMRLAELITLGELKRTFDKGPRNKAPGAYGTVHEFYINFCGVIKMDLLTNTTRNRFLPNAKLWHDCLCTEVSGTA